MGFSSSKWTCQQIEGMKVKAWVISYNFHTTFTGPASWYALLTSFSSGIPMHTVETDLLAVFPIIY